MKTITVNLTEEYTGKSVKDVLNSIGLSSRCISRLKNNPSGIMLNRRRVTVRAVLHAGDLLELDFGDDVSSFEPQNLGVSVLYEDEYAAVFDKPGDMCTHPSHDIQSGTLANAALWHFRQGGENITFRAVNRLDRGTSGTVICAKDAHSSRMIAQSYEKVYICVCHGTLPPSGTFDDPIRRCADSSMRRETGEGGQNAVTRFERLSASGGYSLAAVHLPTGRTHQIRVHFSCAGFPLAGDSLYGRPHEVIARQALHCAAVKYRIGRKTVVAVSPIPDDICRLTESCALLLPSKDEIISLL